MIQTLEQFGARWTGQRCDFDGYFGEQCVDLADFYLRDVWGIPPFFVTGAVDLFGHRPDLIEWIANDAGNPGQFPRPGDLVIWHLDAKVGTGVNGHVDVFLHGDGYRFVGLDENWPLNTHPHQQAHTYEGVKGWGRRRLFSLAGLSPAQLDHVIASQSWEQIMASYGQAGFQQLYARAHPSPPPTATSPTTVPAPTPAPAPSPPPQPVNPPLVSPPPLPGGNLPVAINPPTIEIPEPQPVAEAGVSTSEWKALVGYAVQLAAAETAGLAAKVGLHAPDAVLNTIGSLELLGLVAVVSYIVSRGIRKLGTTK